MLSPEARVGCSSVSKWHRPSDCSRHFVELDQGTLRVTVRATGDIHLYIAAASIRSVEYMPLLELLLERGIQVPVSPSAPCFRLTYTVGKSLACTKPVAVLLFSEPSPAILSNRFLASSDLIRDTSTLDEALV